MLGFFEKKILGVSVKIQKFISTIRLSSPTLDVVTGRFERTTEIRGGGVIFIALIIVNHTGIGLHFFNYKNGHLKKILLTSSF